MDGFSPSPDAMASAFSASNPRLSAFIRGSNSRFQVQRVRRRAARVGRAGSGITVIIAAAESEV